MIVEHYPVEAGKLLAGEYPGHQNPNIARQRIASLMDIGVRTFIDLTRLEDGLLSYEDITQELGNEAGTPMQRIAMPVRDMDVPDSDDAGRAIMQAIRDAIEDSPIVYVHCWGGIGRTGTVVGCWLRECGLDPDKALARVQHLYSTHMPKSLRFPDSPQTAKQSDYVRTWTPTA